MERKSFERKRSTYIESFYRKRSTYIESPHTKCYLDFYSHHPIQHKKSVVNTLLDSASKIPSTQYGRQRERNRVNDTLIENNYPPMFIKQCERARARSRQKKEQNIASEHTSQPSRCITILRPGRLGEDRWSTKTGGHQSGLLTYPNHKSSLSSPERPTSGSPDETKHRVLDPVQKLRFCVPRPN